MFGFHRRTHRCGHAAHHGHRHKGRHFSWPWQSGKRDTQPSIETSAGANLCPLCENQCPLDTPGCGKGAALAARRGITQGDNYE